MRNHEQLPKPTEGELAILHVLWDRAAATVRDVHTVLGGGVAYTTVLKLMQVMHGKGLVQRDDSQRAHVYAPTLGRSVTQRQFLRDMVQRVFQGSPSQLVLQALGSSPPASAEEIKQIRALIERIEKDEG